MKSIPKPPESTDISMLRLDLEKAAIAVRDAGHAIERMLSTFYQITPQTIMEDANAGTIMLEILTDGAYPLPVGSQGTSPIENFSTVPLAVKIGSEAPAWFGPGSVILTIPPGESASIQKTRPDAPDLKTNIVSWISRIRPCMPGVVCLPDGAVEWKLDEEFDKKNGDLTVGGWGRAITFKGDPSGGFSLDRH